MVVPRLLFLLLLSYHLLSPFFNGSVAWFVRILVLFRYRAVSSSFARMVRRSVLPLSQGRSASNPPSLSFSTASAGTIVEQRQ